MKLEYSGILTEGHYNDMEAGYPVFIDGESLSDIVKDLLTKEGLSNNFCYESFTPLEKGNNPVGDWSPSDDQTGKGQVDNPLIGKKVRLILEIEDTEIG